MGRTKKRRHTNIRKSCSNLTLSLGQQAAAEREGLFSRAEAVYFGSCYNTA